MLFFILKLKKELYVFKMEKEQINQEEKEHKHNLVESINFRKRFFKYYKVYFVFCLNCDYKKEVKIKISKDDYFNCLELRTLKQQNTTNKTYTQNIIKK